MACDAILACPVAPAIARDPRSLRVPLVAAVALPLLVGVVRTSGWEVLLGSTGPIATGRGALLRHPVSLLFNIPGMVIGLAQVLLPFMTRSLVGSLANIRPDLEAAAAAWLGEQRRFEATASRDRPVRAIGRAPTAIASISSSVNIGGGSSKPRLRT